jgi:type IV pilus assembly protein PilE
MINLPIPSALRERPQSDGVATPHPPHANAVRERDATNGFTLIELMIVVAVIAILAGLAVPSYVDYVKRGNIVEATNNLSDLRGRLEQYFYDNRRYPGACIPSAAGSAPPGTIYLPDTMRYFAVTCVFPTATTYSLTATGVASEGMGGFAYTLNESNLRRTTGLPAGWSGAGSTCWVTKRGGSC